MIVHLVPQRPPVIDGVGDYAAILADELAHRGHPGVLVAANPRQCSSTRLHEQLPAKGTVVLHYSAYGYGYRGCPLWLIRALEQWRRKEGRVLVTFFHELANFGPPWTSAYWLNPVQRHVLCRLARLSDHHLTSRSAAAGWLRAVTPWDPIQVLPILSNVGELEQPPAHGARPARLVVFGTPGRRRRVYEESPAMLREICARLGIVEIVDIGSPVPLPVDLPIRALGVITAPEIAAALSSAIAGILDYPAALLAKSGIFASYAAFGLLPLIVGHERPARAEDGLERGIHYVSDDEVGGLTRELAQTIATRVHAWYQTHNRAVHAGVIAPLLNQRRPKRALYVSAQRIQNAAALRLLAARPEVRFLMAYCTTAGDTKSHGEEFLNKDAFDTDLQSGYPWIDLRNIAPVPRLGAFWGVLNPRIVSLVRRADVSVIFGHNYATFWLGILTAKICGKHLWLSNDAVSLEGSAWKQGIKRWLLPWLYNTLTRGVLVPCSNAHRYLLGLGVNPERVRVTPYVVDNDWIRAAAVAADRQSIRREWNIPPTALVVVFCAKFISRKRPLDLLRAFARVCRDETYLVLVGDGPLLVEACEECTRLGIAERVRFLGFVAYSLLPRVYAGSDLLVHPAVLEPFGLIVNEAMICGLPVIASDRVGAAGDLVEAGVTGFTFPAGDVERLAELLGDALHDRTRLKEMGLNAARHVASWSPELNVERQIQAIA